MLNVSSFISTSASHIVQPIPSSNAGLAERLWNSAIAVEQGFNKPIEFTDVSKLQTPNMSISEAANFYTKQTQLATVRNFNLVKDANAGSFVASSLITISKNLSENVPRTLTQG